MQVGCDWMLSKLNTHSTSKNGNILSLLDNGVENTSLTGGITLVNGGSGSISQSGSGINSTAAYNNTNTATVNNPTGTAVPSDVRSGKTFIGAAGELETGSGKMFDEMSVLQTASNVSVQEYTITLNQSIDGYLICACGRSGTGKSLYCNAKSVSGVTTLSLLSRKGVGNSAYGSGVSLYRLKASSGAKITCVNTDTSESSTTGNVFASQNIILLG